MKKFLLLLSFVTLSHACTQADYDTARSYIIAGIRSEGGNTAATLLRLSFHDCVSHCDGCINMNNPSNAGLQPAIDIMEDVFASLVNDGIAMTRADLWAIGGRVGAEWGMENMPGNTNFQQGDMKNFVSPFATFKCGRVDCDTAPSTTEDYEFPSPHMTHDDMFQYFRDRFSISDDQIVALIGAHTVGRCSKDNSGYNGPWMTDTNSLSFDNEFYSLMINSSVTYNARNLGTTGDDSRPQYRCVDGSGEGCGIMLNTDFELFYDMGLDSNFQATCDPQVDCPQASTYATAAAYAMDNALWIDDFCIVYDLMTDYVDDTVTLTFIQ